MSIREYTVKMAPPVGYHRAQAYNLVPDDFFVGHKDGGSIVEAELLKIVGAYTHGEYEMPEAVYVQLQAGDHPYGTFETYADCNVLGSMSMKVASRQGWGVVVGFFSAGTRHAGVGDSPQRDGSDRHVVMRVSSRPA